MRSITRSLFAAAMALGLAACGGPGDPNELAEDVVASLQDADFENYFENLVATPQEVLEICPSVTSYKVDQLEHRTHFNECLNAVDFSTVKEITQVQPTLATDASCPGIEVSSEIQVTVATKSAIYTFKIKNAKRTESGWKVTGKLDCDKP